MGASRPERAQIVLRLNGTEVLYGIPGIRGSRVDNPEIDEPLQGDCLAVHEISSASFWQEFA